MSNISEHKRLCPHSFSLRINLLFLLVEGWWFPLVGFSVVSDVSHTGTEKGKKKKKNNCD